jgi:hypothetical protein
MSAGALLWVAVAGLQAGVAAENEGPFEACLQTQAKQWVDARVALVMNDDPAASDIDDGAVAKWTVQTLETCQSKAGRGDQATEQLFVRYMAHWRDHIEAGTADLKRRSRPD